MSPLLNDMDYLEAAVARLQDMLVNVSDYVHRVLVCKFPLLVAVCSPAAIVCLSLFVVLTLLGHGQCNAQDGRIPADNSIGRFLLDLVTSVPVVDATTLDKLYNNSLQVRTERVFMPMLCGPRV